MEVACGSVPFGSLNTSFETLGSCSVLHRFRLPLLLLRAQDDPGPNLSSSHPLKRKSDQIHLRVLSQRNGLPAFNTDLENTLRPTVLRTHLLLFHHERVAPARRQSGLWRLRPPIKSQKVSEGRRPSLPRWMTCQRRQVGQGTMLARPGRSAKRPMSSKGKVRWI